MARRALICGISGQDGAYLAQLLLGKGYEVHGTSRDAGAGHFQNLARLGVREQVTLRSMDLADFRSVLQTLERSEPDEIYNLAGQTSVGLSFEQPVEAFDSIAIGTLNLLEAIRFRRMPARLYNACSSECFGDCSAAPATEETPFRPRSTYATAKAAAHWSVENYREAYGLWACSGILFNHESPLRPDRFVTRKVAAAASRIARGHRERLPLGDLSVVRDWGWAPEYVNAMWLMLQREAPRDYVIATGRSCALEEFVQEAFAEFELDWRDHVDFDPALVRPLDLRLSRGNPARAASELGWQPRCVMPEVAHRLARAEWDAAGD
ncbi:MAG: GDP-mannose 4,6-dehydratase [Betaproteobacteria bacterium]|nr:GDP-mannose 4,6-dehydratase [Betaproteobacteria bacterium]MDH5221198.1 GDP-mannose 4,6-dehydratase [Betaproteobacteria bacterium]MDH5352199.1 GDP-mannose 4,6-dehydratase [Betaproteobacteria bacterium]